MSNQIPESDLGKAEANLKRLEGFFAERISWRTDPACNQALINMDRAAGELITTVGSMLQANGLSFARQRRPEETPQKAPGNLEAQRVERFAGFLQQQHQWFLAAANHRVSGAGRELLRSLHGSLCTTARAVKMILEHNHAAVADTGKVESTAAPAAVTTEPELKPDRVIKVPRLELVNSVERPLLVSFKGGYELSSETKQQIDEFLAANDIVMGQSQSRRYLDKVVRWIEAIPEGQALVLKASVVQDEPYPSYKPKSDSSQPGGAGTK
jgi:hypothetical protein